MILVSHATPAQRLNPYPFKKPTIQVVARTGQHQPALSIFEIADSEEKGTGENSKLRFPKYSTHGSFRSDQFSNRFYISTLPLLMA